MQTLRQPRLALILLLGLALLLMRVGSTHIHLCFDGQEPAVSLHSADSGIHHAETSAAADHADQDIDLSRAVPGKLWSQGMGGAMLLVALSSLLLSLPRPQARRAPLVLQWPLGTAQHFLRPPLRGPPL